METEQNTKFWKEQHQDGQFQYVLKNLSRQATPAPQPPV